MRIRSVTYFLDPGWPLDGRKMDAAARLLEKARAAFQSAGYEVQTLRLACIPFPRLLMEKLGDAEELVRRLDARCAAAGIDYFSIGPALPDRMESFEVLPAALGASPRAFASAIVAEPDRGLCLPAARSAARAIADISTVEANGFANLRFTALACVPPGVPFLPAAYSGGGEPRFALAMESADLAVEAIAAGGTLAEAGRRLTAEIDRHARAIAGAAAGVEGAAFAGIDFSLAPFPEEARSLGTAFERMGVPRTGLAGSALAAGILASALDAATFPRAGFNGLFLPPFEDFNLAARAADGSLTIPDLMLFSTLCGTGLDTIPLPGNATAELLTPLLLDVAALALRHRKPLTVRLMPLPGKQAGDEARFDFDFFAPTRVMALPSEGVGGLMAEENGDWVKILPRC